MATRLTYRQWDGGDSMHDRIINLFDVIESPPEVLAVLYKNYAINSYKGITAPVDHRPYNNVEGLIIQEIPLEDEYSLELIAKYGLSIHALHALRIKGYDHSIGRSPLVFEKTIVRHIESEFGPKLYYGYKGLEKLRVLEGKNYLEVRDTDIGAGLKEDDEKLVYTFPNGEECTKYFVIKKWVEKQEQKLQIIFEIAQTVLGFKSIDELFPLYKKYKPEKAHTH